MKRIFLFYKRKMFGPSNSELSQLFVSPKFEWPEIIQTFKAKFIRILSLQFRAFCPSSVTHLFLHPFFCISNQTSLRFFGKPQILHRMEFMQLFAKASVGTFIMVKSRHPVTSGNFLSTQLRCTTITIYRSSKMKLKGRN